MKVSNIKLKCVHKETGEIFTPVKLELDGHGCIKWVYKTFYSNSFIMACDLLFEVEKVKK